jgi:hypothetical protein
MNKAHLLLFSGMLLLPVRNSLNAEPPTLNAEQLKQVVLFAPKPYFPRRAAKEYRTGAGLFLLDVNPETGRVGSIKIERTTGLWSLDVSCLKTLIRWRFKPHTVTKVHVPVDFVSADGKLKHPATW